MKSLEDVVSGAGLAGYAEVALLIFFAVFLAVAWRVLAANKRSLDRAAHLPLEDDAARPADKSPSTRPERGAPHVER